MAAERELKFRVEDLSELRARLLDLAAERTSKSQAEDNWVFDRGDELRESGCLLRLRLDGHGTLVTFKGPAQFEGAVKVRSEYETRVDDPEAMRSVLEQLGYRAVNRYQKMREEWHVGGILVALDNTPMGDFVEFEGDGAEKLSERCGFEEKDAELKNYVELYSEYRRNHPDAPEEMLLP